MQDTGWSKYTKYYYYELITLAVVKFVSLDHLDPQYFKNVFHIQVGCLSGTVGGV